MKRINWLGTSLNAVQGFPSIAKARIGQQLQKVQDGLMPDDFKPMPTVGSGVYEVRVKAGNQYRVIYVAKYAEWVYVLHAFEKKTQKTASEDVELAKQRYAKLLKDRGSK
jgi:putative addiction module killer protein